MSHLSIHSPESSWGVGNAQMEQDERDAALGAMLQPSIPQFLSVFSEITHFLHK